MMDMRRVLSTGPSLTANLASSRSVPSAGTPAAVALPRSSDRISLSGSLRALMAPLARTLASSAFFCALAATAVAQNAPGLLGQVETLGNTMQERVAPVLDTRSHSVGPLTFQFTPVVVALDPFSQNMHSAETRVSFFRTELMHEGPLSSNSNWREHLGVQTDLLVRQTMGAPSPTDPLHANFIGPRATLREGFTHPLNEAATQDDHNQYEPHGKLASTWLHSPMRFFVDFREGVEERLVGSGGPSGLSAYPSATQPFYRAKVGLQKTFPVHFWGKDRNVWVAVGPHVEGTREYSSRVGPDIDVGFRW